MQQQTEKKPSILGNYYVRIIGTLFLIATVVAVLLALVNSVTAPRIKTLAAEKKATAMAKVMEGAKDFETLTLPDSASEDVTKCVKDIAVAKDGDKVLGYCVQTSTTGNDGEVQLMVGIGVDGAVTKVEILSQKETMYTNKHGELIAQFGGMSGAVALTNDGGQVNAISGATITSRAVTKGVNLALTAAGYFMEGGAQ